MKPSPQPSGTPAERSERIPPVRPPEAKDRLLWWVGGAFALLFAAWTTFFVIASRQHVAEVPLERGPAR